MLDTNEITLYVRTQKSFSFLEYHTDAIFKATTASNKRSLFSLFKTITIANGTDTSYEKLVLHFSTNCSYFSIAPMELKDVKAHVKYPIHEDPIITVDGKTLYELNGIDVMNIDMALEDPETGTILASLTKTIQILPVKQCTNNWALAPLLLAKYCITSFPDAYQVQANALKYLTVQHGEEEEHNASFAGYQYNKDSDKAGRDNVVNEIKALYSALHDWGITYADPENSNGLYQNVRLPNKVLQLKHGTCLDLALLMCSMILHVGLHPILIIVQGHAFAGAFLDENGYFSHAVETSPAKVYSRAILEKDILLLECTTLSFNNSSSFVEAVQMGQSHLDNYGGLFYAIDVHQAQSNCLKPIPIPEENGEVDLSIKPMELHEGGEVDLTPKSFRAIEGDEDPDRFLTWQKKLLELSTKNRLVNFPHKIRKSVVFLNPLGADIYDLLRKIPNGKISIKTKDAVAVDQGDNVQFFDPSSLALAERLLKEKNPTLLGFAPAKQLQRYIKESNDAKEETGSATLYLAIGSVTCREVVPVEAPLLLLPVSITKDRLADSFTMTYDFDDIHLNTTFFEFIKLKVPGADYSSLYGFDSEGGLLDLKMTISRMAKADLTIDVRDLYVANFSFGHYVMWKDITDRKEALLENDTIRSFVENRSLIHNVPAIPEPYNTPIEKFEKMEQFAAPCPYDSTQLRAILECGAGNSFILDGPPGTGKSQTIVNMIVNAFFNHKTVLFVAEKQAALDVVRKRLEKLGLDRFVLELYSGKANKRAMLTRLNDTINKGPTVALEDFHKTCEEIAAKKETIQDSLSHLHRVYVNPKTGTPVARSLYQALLGDSLTEEEKGTLSFDSTSMEAYSLQADADIQSSLGNLIAILKGSPEAIGSPLRAFAYEGNFLGYSGEIRKAYTDLAGRASILKADLDTLQNKVPFRLSRDLAILPTLLETLNKGLEKHIVFRSLGEAEFFEGEAPKKMRQFNEDLKRFHYLSESLEGKYNVGLILKTPLSPIQEALSKKGFLQKGLGYRKALRLLKECLCPSFKPTREQLEGDVDRFSTLQSLQKSMNEALPLVHEFYGDEFEAKWNNPELCSESYEETYALFEAAKNDIGGTFAERISYLQMVAATRPLDLRELLKKIQEDDAYFQQGYNEVTNLYAVDKSEWTSEGFLDEVLELANALSQANNDRIIRTLLRARKEAKPLFDQKMNGVYYDILSGRLPLSRVEVAYENAIDRAFIDFYFKHDDFFSTFDRSLYEKTILEYQKQIEDYNRCSVEEVTSRLTKDFPDVNLSFQGSSALTTLRKLAGSSGRGKTIRWILSTYEKYIRMYYPCFLMSPSSAAQYLDLSSAKFDIVIFDEASQIPTCEAVGPIARGHALIVAGDPEQMPPTSYFQSNIEGSDENYSVETTDAESLLDDCISVGLPRIRLSYHYRSQHQSLIEFSNENFYDSGLFTFPSADALNPHVFFRYIELSRLKKTNAMSEQEKQAILEELVTALKKPENRLKSFGIIVFNTQQQDVLSDALETFFNKPGNETLRQIAYGEGEEFQGKDPLFIKNLENVQGDERDIVFISIGFAKTSDGKAAITGPLALEKGERRLNVAASRAKEEIHVLSTIRATDIRSERSKNSGPAFLKRFLEFAENSIPHNKALSTSQNEKDAATLLAKDLCDAGLTAEAHVGNSRFTVDVALREPDAKTYVLGILIDQKPLGALTCRDRYYVDEGMLSHLGWQLLRIYCFDYFSEKEKIIENIRVAYEKAKTQKVKQETEKSWKPLLTDSSSVIDYPLTPYESYEYKPLEEYGINYDQLVKDTSIYDPKLAKLLTAILRKEQPILFDKLIKDLCVHVFGKARLGNKGKDYVSLMLNRIEAPQTISGNRVFYWAPGNEDHEVQLARIGGNKIQDISKEEIAFAMGQIVKSGKINERNLVIRSTAKSFGFYPPMSQEVFDYLGQIYDEAHAGLDQLLL